MGRGVYNVRCRKNEELKHVLELQDHQKRTLEYFLKTDHKGLVLFHKLGSGKTCISIVIADTMLKRKMVKHVYIFSPGSLRSSWIKEYCQKCGTSTEILERDYTFITYNYRLKDIPNLDGSLVIVDEIHNLINGKRNKSTHPSLIYDAILNSNCRVLALSGTPVFRHLNEFPLLLNLVKPKKDDLEDYNKLFSKAVIESKDFDEKKFRDSISGVISYFPGGSDLPEVIQMPPLKFQMTREQELEFWKMFNRESVAFPPKEHLRSIDPKKYFLLRTLYILSRKRILSRKISNFYYPPEAYEYQKDSDWLATDPLKDNALSRVYSPKIAGLLANIVLHPNQKQIVFTFFKNRSGVHLIKALLSKCGISSTVFVGDMNDDDRRRVLNKFNSKENSKGKIVPIMIFSSAGGEGLSLTDVRQIHILESDPTMNKVIQSIGRAVRFKSHENLPEKDRTVHVWKYWSVPSPEPITLRITKKDKELRDLTTERIITDKTGIDERLYMRGSETLDGINMFLDLIKKESVT